MKFLSKCICIMLLPLLILSEIGKILPNTRCKDRWSYSRRGIMCAGPRRGKRK